MTASNEPSIITTNPPKDASHGADTAPPPFELTDMDRAVLAQTDAEFHYYTWEDLEEIIAANQLETLKRKPSALRRYIAWSSRTKAQYGSITNYIAQERLHWTPLPRSSSSAAAPVFPLADPTHPLSDPSDYRILPNDWPYTFRPGISHTVVWLKHILPVDPVTGDLTPASKALVAAFVQKLFIDVLREKGGAEDAEDRILWFKNWTRLQSVRGIEHFHVLGRDVPEEVLLDWTAGTRAVLEEVEEAETKGPL